MKRSALAEFLIEYRNQYNISKTDMAKLLCVKLKTYEKIESDLEMPSLNLIKKMIAVFGVTGERLLYDRLTTDNKILLSQVLKGTVIGDSDRQIIDDFIGVFLNSQKKDLGDEYE